MERILVVSSNEKLSGSVRELLGEESTIITESAGSAGTARDMMLQKEYDLILINLPLSDEPADQFAAEAAENTAAGVLLLVEGSREEEYEAKMLPYGVLVLGKPLGRKLFMKMLHLVDAARIRLLGVKQENVRLHKTIDDSRIINRAKAILTEYLNMTEPQAHKYLERQAMELRVPKIEVAKRLLSTYEN